MKKHKIAAPVLAGVLLISLLAGCGAQQNESTSAPEATAAAAAEEADSGTQSGLGLGDSFPDFTADLCDGSTFTLSEELKSHKAVLINIWAIYCGPCRKEFPDLNEVYLANADDVAFVCLSCNGDDTLSAIETYKNDMGLDLPMGRDTSDLYHLIGTGMYPTTVVIDRFGSYVYCNTGAFSGADAIQRVLDAVTGDDYTQSRVITELPAIKPDVQALPDAELTSLVCSDGSLSFTTPSDDEYCWPFVKAGEGVTNSNACKDPTGYADGVCAEMDTTVEAKAGDVFAFDYCADTAEPGNGLTVSVNGNRVRFIGGREDGTYAYAFPENGTYEIKLVYRTYGMVEDTSDSIVIQNAVLTNGKTGEALLAGMKTYPQTLEGTDISIEFGNAREITFIDENNAVANRFGPETKFYIADGSTVDVHLCLGCDADPYHAALSNSADESYLVLARMDTDETGFSCSEKLISVEEAGCSYSFFDAMADYYGYAGIGCVVFVNEENANYFVKNDVLDENDKPVAGITWMYADGTKPSTDQIADASAGYAAEKGTAAYTIHIVDENGEPVDGCLVNICTDVNCSPTTAAGGELTFTREAYPYIIHVIRVPDGYAFDTGSEFIMPEEGGELTITVPHSK